MIESRVFRRIYATVTLFTVLAPDFWRYLAGWWGYGSLAAVIVAIAVLTLWRRRKSWRLAHLPFPLIAFLALSVLSIAWSDYREASVLGVLTTIATVTIAVALALAFTWDELLWALGLALRVILALSLLFEFIVAVFVRHPVLPLVPSPGVDYTAYETLPKLLYWSRNLLFDGGKIQGIVGNSSLLGFLALVALIVFAVQFANRSANRALTALWFAVAAATAALTRSATITLAIVAILLALAAILLLRRTEGRAHTGIYAAIVVLIAALATAALVFRSEILGLLGKSDDLTGRLDIWNAVIGLAEQRPVVGWGWVSFWVPWVEPFESLVFKGGVRQLHAHNAWLDVWLQLGIIGVVIFGALVLSTAVRSWQFALDRPQRQPGAPLAYSTVSLLPVLLLVALLVQSLAESRILIEGGLILLVIVAVKTKITRD